MSLASLRQSPLLSGLDDDALRSLLPRLRLERVDKRYVFSQQRVVERFYFLLSGRLKLYGENPDTGRTLTLFLLGEGDAFDVLNLLDGSPSGLSVEALDDAELASTPIEEARRWLSEHPPFNQAFLRYVGSRIRQLSELTSDIALHGIEARLAKLILRHVDESQPEHPVKLINDLSDEEIAAMIGSVRAVVNRQLQHWRREHVLASRRDPLKPSELHALIEQIEEDGQDTRRG